MRTCKTCRTLADEVTRLKTEIAEIRDQLARTVERELYLIAQRDNLRRELDEAEEVIALLESKLP